MGMQREAVGKELMGAWLEKKRVTDKSQEGHNHALQTSYTVIQENQKQSKGKPNFAQPTLETSLGFDDIFL